MFGWFKKLMKRKVSGGIWNVYPGDKFTCRVENGEDYYEVTNKTNDGLIRQYYRKDGHTGCQVLTNNVKRILFEME